MPHTGKTELDTVLKYRPKVSITTFSERAAYMCDTGNVSVGVKTAVLLNRSAGRLNAQHIMEMCHWNAA